MKARRHSPAEISAKLEQAEALAADGRVQSEIAKALGVSVMTLHRWRKLDHPAAPATPTGFEAAHGARRGRADIVAELQMENRQLRKIVTDLLLEKIKLEEAAGPRAA
jgi:putative transposase